MRYNGKTYGKSIMQRAIDMLRLSKNRELSIQTGIVEYLRMKKILVFSVPNGSYFANAVTRALMTLAGLTAGVSDLILVLKGTVIFVEVKTEAKSSKQSDEQIEFQKQVEALGFTYLIWKDVDEAIYFVNHREIFGAKR